MGSLSKHRIGLAIAASSMLVTASGAQVFVVGMKTATADALTEFHPTHVELPTAPLDERGRRELIRDLEAEQGFAHRELPLGAGLTLLANGNLTPRDEEYRRMLYQKGQSASPGDRVEVTALQFHADSIVLDFNGGPYAKHRFLSHLSLNDMPVAQQGPIATGCRITLVFEGGIPELSAAEVKELLDPVVDFKAKSSAEAFADSLPPKVRDAVQSHEVLVGMDRHTVLAAMGEPHSKHREHEAGGDPNSPTWEEWIYGEPPQPTQFVRFREGRVVRLEIAALGKPLEIREKNETGGNQGPVLQPRTIANGDAQPSLEGLGQAQPPTLRRAGDPAETASTMGKVRMPAQTGAGAPQPPPTGATSPASGSPPASATQPGTAASPQ